MTLIKTIFASLLLVASTQVMAVTLQKEPYSTKRFTELQATDTVVLVDVYAPWCPTCKKQQEALADYRKANPSKKFIILEVDYDEQREAVRYFRAPRQATLLIYRGKKQHWFSVAETRPEVIAEALNNAINYKYKAKYDN